MRNLVIFMTVVFAALLLTGCAANGRYISYEEHEKIERYVKYEGDYKLGEQQTAYIGAAFISGKAFEYSKYTYNAMIAQQDFSVDLNRFDDKISTFKAGTPFKILGEIDLDSKRYTAINYHDMSHGYLLMIDANGEFVAHGYETWHGADKEVFRSAQVQSDVKFKPVNNYVQWRRGTNLVNYELIYTGNINGVVSVIYRETTLYGDYARPAFMQNLTYAANQKQIRFKNLLIQIIKADNEKIVFKVVSDE